MRNALVFRLCQARSGRLARLAVLYVVCLGLMGASLHGAGMNLFLKNLDITFRRDPTNYRPRINKGGSVKDQEQKSAGSYYYLDD